MPPSVTSRIRNFYFGRAGTCGIFKQHGTISGGRWMVLGMGKLGGREMTPSSDLDLIVIYDHDAGAHKSDGKKSLAPGQYYSRLTKRLINSLTAPTAEGNLFEVDMRLRPSGTAGPLASHINAFTKYHDESSWAWEHMALAKARAISGNAEFINQVNQVIEKTLTRTREPIQLLADVAGMRGRIDKEHRTGSILEIKYYRGASLILNSSFNISNCDTQPIIRPSYALILRALSRNSQRTIIGHSDAELLQRALTIFRYSRPFATYPGRTVGRTQLTHASKATAKKSRGSRRVQHTGGPRGVFGDTCDTCIHCIQKNIWRHPSRLKPYRSF